jgi:hypothetical protein
MKTYKPYTRQSLYTAAGLIILVAILISAYAPVREPDTEQVIAFTNVNLIPMNSKTVIENQTELARGSAIVENWGNSVGRMM